MEYTHMTRESRWECPHCGRTAVTFNPEPHTEYHNCPAFAGFSIPLLAAGVKACVKLVEREDYVGSDIVRYDGRGKAIMAAVVEREDGEDRFVYAPLVQATIYDQE